MLRTQMLWTGFPGAPGYTNMFWNTTSDLAGANLVVTQGQQFADAIHFLLPANVTVQVSQEVQDVDPATGNLLGIITATAASPAWVGTDTGLYAAPAGACISWKTAGIHPGVNRPGKVRGRTFIVPLGGDQYDASGTLLDAARTTLQAATTQLVANRLGIWARPKPLVPGALYDVTAASVADKVAILRSRRD